MTQIPIYVVSLADSAERRANITQQLTDMNLSFEFLDAVDGRNGLPAEYEAMIDREGARKRLFRDMTDSEFGCALSHHLLYAKIVANQTPWTIIMEDDGHLLPAFADFVAMPQPQGAELITINHHNTRVRPSAGQELAPGITWYRLWNTPFCTGAYALSLKMAETLLTATQPVTHTADWPVELWRHRAYAVYPELVTQPADHAGSYINADRKPKTEAKEGRRGRLLTWRYYQKTLWKRLSTKVC